MNNVWLFSDEAKLRDYCNVIYFLHSQTPSLAAIFKLSAPRCFICYVAETSACGCIPGATVDCTNVLLARRLFVAKNSNVDSSSSVLAGVAGGLSRVVYFCFCSSWLSGS